MYKQKALIQFTTYLDWRHEHTHAHTQNDRTKWSLLRPSSDLSTSCDLQVESTRAAARGEPNPGTGERPLRFLRGGRCLSNARSCGGGGRRARPRPARQTPSCEDPLLLYILSGALVQASFVSGTAQPFPHLALCQANRWVGA